MCWTKTYPVGGFTSISTKGSVEASIHSLRTWSAILTCVGPVRRQVPPRRTLLLLRDENQFLRRRRIYLFCLYPDLVKARFKDAELPVQRIVAILGLLLTAVRKLSEWLSTDALKFEFLLVQDKGSKPLGQEGALLEMLFREQIENQTVEVVHLTEDPARYADRRAERSLCQLLSEHRPA